MGPHAHESAVLKNWHIWTTPAFGAGESWSAAPIGAAGAVVFASDRAALEENIGEYMRNADAHVREAREKLDALPAHWTGEREVQERLIGALARLARRSD